MNIKNIMVLFIQSSPVSLYLYQRRPKYPPQHLILEHPQPMFLPQCERPCFAPTQNRLKFSYVDLHIFRHTKQNQNILGRTAQRVPELNLLLTSARMRYCLKIKSNDLFRPNKTTYIQTSASQHGYTFRPHPSPPSGQHFNIKSYYLCALYIMGSHTVYRMCVRTIIKVI